MVNFDYHIAYHGDCKSFRFHIFRPYRFESLFAISHVWMAYSHSSRHLLHFEYHDVGISMNTAKVIVVLIETMMEVTIHCIL